MKNIELKKFTDEDMIRYEWELNALYQGREHFVRDFQELYVNGNCQIERINDAIPMMIEYLNDFATSARVWDNILATSKYKSYYAKKWEYRDREMDDTRVRILNSYRPTENDTANVVDRLYATIAVALYNATFAPDGQYRVVKMAYREFKSKIFATPKMYRYVCADTSKCMAVYVKTGAYDPETKTIEVYVPANWDGDDAEWWHARQAGDLPEIAAEMAAQRAAEAESETETEDTEIENKNENDDENEEENEMNKENFIDMVDRYYDRDCYEAAELVVSESTKEKCRELIAYSEGPEDRRDKTAAEIHKKLIEYLETLPEEHFEEILSDYNDGFDELVDLIYEEYIAAPFEIDYNIEE